MKKSVSEVLGKQGYFQRRQSGESQEKGLLLKEFVKKQDYSEQRKKLI